LATYSISTARERIDGQFILLAACYCAAIETVLGENWALIRMTKCPFKAINHTIQI
jgi:hypothetical protein